MRTAVERLRSTALSLAAEAPDRELTVDVLVSRAGLSRDDFYRNATSPVRVLAEALSDEVLTQLEAVSDSDPGRGPDWIEERARISLTHIARWAQIYRGPIRREVMAALRDILTPIIAADNADWLRSHPELIPAGFEPDDETTINMIAMFSAGGNMAAVEVWVEDPQLDVERGIRLLKQYSPMFVHSPGSP